MATIPDAPTVADPLGRSRPPDAPPVTGPWTGPGIRVEHVSLGRSGGVPTHVAGLVRHPLLERALERRRHAVALALAVGQGLLGSALFVVVGVLHLALAGADAVSPAVTSGLLAVVVTALSIRAHRRLRLRVIEAGARAVALLDGGGRGSWVETHRLADVDLTPSRSGTSLHLIDLEGRRVVLPCGLLEANPALWALVRAGIEASASDGARVGARVRRRLELPPARGPRQRTEQE